MSTNPPDTAQSPVDDPEITYCYGHPDTPTRLRCTRCDKPICPRCSVPASVGQHCVWCVAEARKTAPKVRSTIRASAPVVTAIIAINVAVYVLESVLGDPFIARFAAVPPNIADGEWYRLFSPMFLHAPLGTRFGIFHILMNMYILFTFGPSVEGAFGRVRFLTMYLMAGFTGGVLSYLLGSCAVSGVGASGAIFGIVGVLIVYLRRRRTSGHARAYLGNLTTFVLLNLLIGFAVPGIDNWAHIGGLLGGMALGAGLDAGDGVPVSRARQVAVVGAVLAVGIALVMYRTDTMAPGCFAFLRQGLF